MKTVSLAEITKIAHQLLTKKQSWHFHLLTPTCQLNKAKKHAFVLEDISSNQIFVHYSNTPQMALGKQLLKALHGIDLNKDNTTKLPTSNRMLKILNRALELTHQGKLWHHHTLLPQCIYNPNVGQWTIYFEDPENHQVLTSQGDQEPKNDLLCIEKLYYQQKTIS